MNENDLNNLNTELRRTLKKYEYTANIDFKTSQEIVQHYIHKYGSGEQGVAVAFMGIGNLLKHLACICEKYEPGYWEEIMSDDVVRMSSDYATALLKCRKRSD